LKNILVSHDDHDLIELASPKEVNQWENSTSIEKQCCGWNMWPITVLQLVAVGLA